mmetsp:Transcript_7554/g.15460  ORF Transcript_7554/g.15460 Transcript_7554/m.15460 type:complete len:226 (+) Transcript_7554:1261-1938(+)
MMILNDNQPPRHHTTIWIPTRHITGWAVLMDRSTSKASLAFSLDTDKPNPATTLPRNTIKPMIRRSKNGPTLDTTTTTITTTETLDDASWWIQPRRGKTLTSRHPPDPNNNHNDDDSITITPPRGTGRPTPVTRPLLDNHQAFLKTPGPTRTWPRPELGPCRPMMTISTMRKICKMMGPLSCRENGQRNPIKERHPPPPPGHTIIQLSNSNHQQGCGDKPIPEFE